MAKQRNPNGLGNYRKLKDGRIAWRQSIDGEVREVSAKSMPELQEKVKQIVDLPIIKNKYKTYEWFDKWLEIYVKPLKSPATYQQYNDIYRVHIKPIIGNRKIINIKTVDIQLVISEMNKKELSAWTMIHARKIMNIAFKKAFKEKIISTNPVVGIEIPQKQAKERKVLTSEELRLLFNQLKTSRWIWCVKFILYTGIRRGEALALKWSDIDFINKRITIDESNSSTGLKDTKSGKVHYVPLSDKVINVLNGQKNQLVNEFNPILHNNDKKKSNLIFPNKSGVLIKPKSFYTVMYRAANKVGIKATPHMLRHTFVYNMREILSLKEIQAILGHDESTTTLDIYGDMINSTTDKVAARIDDVFIKLDNEINRDVKIGKVLAFKRK